ncbi:hypothetical protein KC19_9G087800 [Ceratodon purpureus]|uniref:Uncharacterized protein n=1 Tax=Ceratodon purpureus TaxID=3225 RepID=A0A8T0GXW2_CERPU|nr:hypothetical protein KC19_9G087800 [Ceratodon purpureus]
MHWRRLLVALVGVLLDLASKLWPCKDKSTLGLKLKCRYWTLKGVMWLWLCLISASGEESAEQVRLTSA